MLKSKLELGKWEGKDTLSIWEVNDQGDKIKKFPLVAFGLRKAQAILAHIEEIKQFVAARESTKSSQ